MFKKVLLLFIICLFFISSYITGGALASNFTNIWMTLNPSRTEYSAGMTSSLYNLSVFIRSNGRVGETISDRKYLTSVGGLRDLAFVTGFNPAVVHDNPAILYSSSLKRPNTIIYDMDADGFARQTLVCSNLAASERCFADVRWVSKTSTSFRFSSHVVNGWRHFGQGGLWNRDSSRISGGYSHIFDGRHTVNGTTINGVWINRY